jgi:hypothetical protein
MEAKNSLPCSQQVSRPPGRFSALTCKCGNPEGSHFRCLRKNEKSDYQLRHACPFVLTSVRPHKNSAPHWSDFNYTDMSIFRKSFEKILTRIADTLHEGLRTFMIASRLLLLKMRIQPNLVEKIKTHILCSMSPKIVTFTR